MPGSIHPDDPRGTLPATATPTATDTGRDKGRDRDMNKDGDRVGAEGEPSRFFLVPAYTFGGLAGLALGFYGVFLVPAGPRPGGVLLSVGVALAALGNVALAMLVRWLTGTRLGAMMVLVGWIPVVLWFGSSRPEGDILLQANTVGYLFLVVGSVAPVVVAMIGQPRRGLFALSPGGT